MIQQIKDLLAIKDEITSLSKKFEEHSITVRQFQNEFESIEQELSDLREYQKNIRTELKEDRESISELKEEFRKEINDFKLIKSRLEQKIIEKFEVEIKEMIVPKLNMIDRHVKGFEDMAQKVDTVSKRTQSLSGELQKFCEIGQNIKKEDYELARFATQLRQADNEKLELMKKIDTLERLIAKMRRSPANERMNIR